METPTTPRVALRCVLGPAAIALAWAVLLGGCAVTPDRVADTGALTIAIDPQKNPHPWILQEGMRLQRVAYRLKRGAAAWCGTQVHHETGLSLWCGAAAAELDMAMADSPLPAGPRPAVLFVAPDSAAARAGLQPGDVFEAVDGTPVADDAAGLQQLRRWIRDLATAGRPSTVGVRRGSQAVETTIEPDRVCDITLTLRYQSYEHAHMGPGHHLTLSQPVVGALNDDLLAFAIAHIVSHDLLGHREMGRQQGDAAAVADLPFFVVGVTLAIASMGAYPQAAAMPFSTAVEQRQRQAWEPLADQWALYMAAAAGFDVSRVEVLPIVDDIGGFRLQAAEPQARVARLREVAQTVEALRRAGVPLEPTAEALKAAITLRGSAPPAPQAPAPAK
jgi:hypothetical protein